jgi:hypothetical protein
MKFVILQFPPASCYFLWLPIKIYLPQHLDTENLLSFNVTYVTVMLSLCNEVLIFSVLLNSWVRTFMHVLALWHWKLTIVNMQHDAEKTLSQLKSLWRTPKLMDGHLNPKSFTKVTGHFITVPTVNPKQLHCVMLILSLVLSLFQYIFGIDHELFSCPPFSFENFNCNFLENTNMLMKHKILPEGWQVYKW